MIYVYLQVSLKNGPKMEIINQDHVHITCSLQAVAEQVGME